MEFSVITPCRAEDSQVIHALADSLEKQTYHQFEWVVISPKGHALQLPNQDWIHQTCFSGIMTTGHARNVALKVAHGDYLVFVDADDYLKPDALRTMDHLIDSVADPLECIFNLNRYNTYEPYSAYLKSLKIANHLGDYPMPEWGGKRSHDPGFVFEQLKLGEQQDMIHPSPLLDNKAHLQEMIKFIHPDNHYVENSIVYHYYDLVASYFRFKSYLSIEGKVVPYKMIAAHHLQFDTKSTVNSELPFMLRALQWVHGIYLLNPYYYVKVHHNDPIDYPSTSQTISRNRWVKWIYACRRAFDAINDRQVQSDFVSWVLWEFSRYAYKGILYRYSFSESMTPVNIRLTLQAMRSFLIHCQPRHYRIGEEPLKTLVDKGTAAALTRIRQIYELRNIHSIVHRHGRGLSKFMYFHHYLKLPVNPRMIIYSSFLGRNYSDNPKYIFRYLQKYYPGYFVHVWVADRAHFSSIRQDLRSYPNTMVVRRWGFKHMKALAIAKYFVNNMRQPKWLVKRPGMKFLETWHGTPLKKLLFDMNFAVGVSHSYKRTFYHQSRQWNYLIADNPFSYQIFQHAFKYPRSKIIKTGYPRNDILYSSHRDEIALQVKRSLGIPLNKKVILYAPTWRDNQLMSSSHYKFTLTLNIPLLKKYLSQDYVLVLRTHYFITNHLDTSQFGSFVYNASDYSDISKLYLISDLLITDYSSVFFDYANLKRPILFYVYDYDTYAKVLHGFYLNMKNDLPGPLIKTSYGILQAIQHLGQMEAEYHNRYRKFNERFNAWDDGHASARAVRALLHESD